MGFSFGWKIISKTDLGLARWLHVRWCVPKITKVIMMKKKMVVVLKLWSVSRLFTPKMLWCDFIRILLMILGVFRQCIITWANIDPYLQHFTGPQWVNMKLFTRKLLVWNWRLQGGGCYLPFWTTCLSRLHSLSILMILTHSTFKGYVYRAQFHK